MSLEKITVKPSETQELDQSNIFENIKFNAVDRNLKGILVTPACNLAHDKGVFLFCAVLNYEKMFPVEMKNHSMNLDELSLETLSISKKKSIINIIKRFLNSQVERYHWLGKIPGADGYWYVDYNLSECIKPENLKMEDRIAILDSPLRESVPTRYSNYLNKIGLPWEDEHREELANEILSEYMQST